MSKEKEIEALKLTLEYVNKMTPASRFELFQNAVALQNDVVIIYVIKAEADDAFFLDASEYETLDLTKQIEKICHLNTLE